MWSILKSIYSSNNKNFLTFLKFDDGIIHDANLGAERLNEYFIHSIIAISCLIPVVDLNLRFYINFSSTLFCFQEISFVKVKILLDEMKKKYYIDNITGKVLLDATGSSDFLISLTNFLNASLSQGNVPDSFKISTATPIQKVTNSNNVSDRRPINTLSVCSQILERIVKDQLLDHFEEKNLF